MFINIVQIQTDCNEPRSGEAVRSRQSTGGGDRLATASHRPQRGRIEVSSSSLPCSSGLQQHRREPHDDPTRGM